MRAMLVLAALGVAACGREGPPASTSTSTSTSSNEIAVGSAAPDFTATTHDGKALHLAELKGKPVVIYFYPQDETPGCTKEACAFRDAWDELAKTNVVLIGVSTDTDASHAKFVASHKLPFQLISDPRGELAKKFGVPLEDGATDRQTFVIGADGNVKKIYRQVNVANHAREVLEDLKP